MDEKTYVSNVAQPAMVLRYMMSTVVVELITDLDVARDKEANDIAGYIIAFLEEYKCLD